MPVQPIHLPVLAKEKEDENWRFRQFLKQRCRLDPDEIDQRVFEITQRVWAGDKPRFPPPPPRRKYTPRRTKKRLMIHETLSTSIEDLSARMIAIRDSL